jgi:hypothetical protein
LGRGVDVGTETSKGIYKINVHHLLVLYCGASARKEMDRLSQLTGEGGGLAIYLLTL